MKTDKFGILIVILIFIFLLLAASAIRAQTGMNKASSSEQNVSASGQFTITKSVIAGGGAEMQYPLGGIQNTAGQTIAGGISNGGGFSLSSGFWTPENFAPTAAAVTLGGRVMTAPGGGIRNARVTIFLPSGETRSTQTGAFGFYRFNDIQVGAVYVFTVSSKRFVFSQTTQILTVNGNRDDINFIALNN